ncbi:hypothetical protein D3M70_16055 [Pseudomonas sp. LS-2]|nr:hypothetical protein D3M70_16055 [Pseudomonas sp. LS-2]
MKGGYKTTISIDGVKIPNVQLTSKFYEELDAGENVTLYGLFKNSSKKEKNDGVLYGLKKASGERMFATHFRFVVPMMLTVYAALAFCLVFVLGWMASTVPVVWLYGKEDINGFIYHTTVFALVEACLAAGFFLWRAWLMVSVTNDPESWNVMSPAALSTRFSKFHK